MDKIENQSNITNKERLFNDNKILAKALIRKEDWQKDCAILIFRTPDNHIFKEIDYNFNVEKTKKAAIDHTIIWLNSKVNN